VSIRDLGGIVEAVGDKARLTRDPALLAEYARQALGRSIVAPYLDATRRCASSPSTRARAGGRQAHRADRRGRAAGHGPVPRAALVRACAEQVDAALGQGLRPVLLCSARVRRHLRRLCEQALPQLAVCSYHEVPPGVRVETAGVLQLDAVPADVEPVPAF
jgi:flagellar biosynthesis protein FlhA